MDKEIINKLKYLIFKNRSLTEMQKELNLDAQTIYTLVEVLQKDGYYFDIINGVPTKVNFLPKQLDVYEASVENPFEICFLSDPHYCSLYDRVDVMEDIYGMCIQRDITAIFCCGDLTEGYFPHNHNHRKEIKAATSYLQAEYVANEHPYSNNITFYTIGGNHDARHIINEGIDIGKLIAQKRNDIIYLGPDEANVKIGELSLKMFHGKGALSSKSFKAKEYYDLIPSDDKPDILQVGHFHKGIYTTEDKTHILQTGALIDSIPRVTQMGLTTERSCWFVKLEYDGRGKLIKLTPELQTFNAARVRKKIIR